ncbi:MAG TPA: hypothetical protein VK060_04645 [Ruania sp.]|nr:hypothetical protein [Ruania sp.]
MEDPGFIVAAVMVAGAVVILVFVLYSRMRVRLAETEGSTELQQALARSQEVNEQLLAELQDVRTRVQSIERILTEVG